jgi:glutamine synthetase
MAVAPDTNLVERARSAVDALAERGVRVVRVVHSDLFGRARSKQFPLDELPSLMDGLGYTAAHVVEGIDGIPLEGGGFPADVGFPDLHALVDLDTGRVLPWEPDTVWFQADLYEAGEPSPLCSRGVLKSVGSRLAAKELRAVWAAESELYFLSEEGSQPYSPMSGMAYTAGRRADPAGAVGRIHRQLIDFGIGVTALNHEFSPGQFEINIRHTEVVSAGDRAFLFKEAVKELARREGLFATFMPKPFTDDAGNSLHIHISLWRGSQNLFAGPDGLSSTIGEQFAAGVLAHASALTAIGCSTVNSYKRLVPGGLAPTTATFGGDSREVYVRVPPGTGEASRLEVRVGDAAANPYLLAASIVAAGLDGMERELRPSEIPAMPLPTTLDTALAELEGDDILVEALGKELIRVYIALKVRECKRFANTVTDWEWNEYAFHS